MENLALIVALLALGQLLRRTKDFPEDAPRILTSFVVYVSLPALILVHIPKVTLAADAAAPVAVAWGILAVSAMIVWSAARAIGWDRSTTGALMLVVPLGNTSFLGIPMVETFFGKEGVPYAILYDQLGTFLALATYGAVVQAVYAGKERPTVSGVLKKVVTFPPFIALAVAFVLRPWTQPAGLENALKAVAASLVPIAMVAVGLRMRIRLPPGQASPFAFGLFIKLILAPLIVLAVCRGFTGNGLSVRVAIFESGMPPQTTAWIVAMAAGLAPELAAAMVGFGIILSMGTLWALAQAIGGAPLT